MFVAVAVEVEDDVAILSDRQRMAHSVEEHAVRVVALLARLPRDADLDLAVDFRIDLAEERVEEEESHSVGVEKHQRDPFNSTHIYVSFKASIISAPRLQHFSGTLTFSELEASAYIESAPTFSCSEILFI